MIGDIIKLEGISRHGKNRVREFGQDWIIMSEPEPMICFNGELGIKIAPVTIDDPIREFISIDRLNSRNIQFPVDKDFKNVC